MKVKLESFLQEISEKTTENDQHPVLTSSKAGLFLQRDYFNKQVASKDNTGYKIIRRGQFTYRAMSDTGEFFPNMLECTDIGIVSPAYPVFEITKQDIVIPEFLKYFFKSDSFQHSIAAFAQGSTRTSVKFGKMKTVEITLPSVPEQRHIVEVLDRAKTVIEVREQELQKLDELVNARFVELFGDPETNPKGWNRQRLDQICENLDSRRVPITSTDRKAGRYPYYGASGIVDYVEDYIFDEDILLISEDGANLAMRSTPIAFSVSGKVWVNNHAHVVRFESKATQKYIEICFALTDISGSITGTAQPKLNQAKLNAMMFCIPPIELQEQFAAFVEQTDKSKASNPTESGSTGDVTILFVVNQLRKKSR